MSAYIFDNTANRLGEGPIWHPTRQQLFWFDIHGQKLLSRKNDVTTTWDLDEIATAAVWLDNERFLIATETALRTFDIATGYAEHVADLEADNPITRSNDGRADPYGGFWIGTMGKEAEHQAGAIYRYYHGEVRELFPNISIPNSICFSPDGGHAYFTDTAVGDIMRQKLEPKDGWPIGDPEVFIPSSKIIASPDGAVIDAAGNLWNAEWGGWRVACYSPAGDFIRDVKIDASNVTCPAFGGPDLTTLYCTTAENHVSDENRPKSENHGKTFAVDDLAKGQAEHQVIL